MKTVTKLLAISCAYCVGLAAFVHTATAEGRVFVVRGRALVVDRPFRPGPAVDPLPAATTASLPVTPRIEPPKQSSVVDNIVPPKFGQHFLPQPGDYTPRHYNGVTVVQLPPQGRIAPDPTLGAPAFPGASSGLPPTIPGPRIVTPNGLQPGHDPFRPSPFDPDVLRRQGYKRF